MDGAALIRHILADQAPAPAAPLVAYEERLTEDVPFHLEFIETVLDHVADADNTAEPPTVDHRNVSNAMTRHPAHHRGDAVVRRTGDDGRGHRLGHGQCEQLRSVLRQAADNVPFRNQAQDCVSVVANDEGANALQLQVPRDCEDGRKWATWLLRWIPWTSGLMRLS